MVSNSEVEQHRRRSVLWREEAERLQESNKRLFEELRKRDEIILELMSERLSSEKT